MTINDLSPTENRPKTKKQKGNGEGSVYKTIKNGKTYWNASVTTGFEDGKQKRKHFSGKTRKDVAEKMTAFLTAQQKGTAVHTNNITLSEYIEHWLQLKKRQVKKTTYESYVDTCNIHIKPIFGSTKLQKLSTAHFNLFFADLHNHLKPSSIQRCKAILSNILGMAVRENIIPINYITNCNPIKATSPEEIHTLSQPEITLLLSTAKTLHDKPGIKFHYLYHVVLLALATGARRGELLALKWENVDLVANTITIKENLVEVAGGVHFETPKTNSSIRTISVESRVLSELYSNCNHQLSGLIFKSSKGNPITPSNLSRAFRSLLQKTGLTNTRFHDLRHTHATQLIAAGYNIKLVSVRLGHEDIRTTLQIYAHALPSQDKDAANTIGDMLFTTNSLSEPYSTQPATL